jgi:hypothetical protein
MFEHIERTGQIIMPYVFSRICFVAFHAIGSYD